MAHYMKKRAILIMMEISMHLTDTQSLIDHMILEIIQAEAMVHHQAVTAQAGQVPIRNLSAYSNYSEQNFQKTYAPKKNFGSKIEKQPLSYKVGDRVSHQKFGVGTVTEIVDGGRDFEVTVNFDTAGVKRMFASFAKMQKV